jgi:hypothetical protein
MFLDRIVGNTGPDFMRTPPEYKLEAFGLWCSIFVLLYKKKKKYFQQKVGVISNIKHIKINKDRSKCNALAKMLPLKNTFLPVD